MSDASFDDWLGTLLRPATASKIAARLVQALAHQPERASYSSTSELAHLAGINPAGVTRAAQSLGFSGWPALREELRARYLTSLSMLEIATQHAEEGPGSATRRSYAADQRALSTTAARADDSIVAEIASVVARASTRLALGTGSYAAVAQLLAMNASLAGYPLTSLPEGAPATNAIARLEPGDVLVAISFWRISESTLRATRYAREIGATICVVTDHAPSAITDLADHVLKITAEGGAHFPTMVPAVALINALCSELAALDPERTKKSIQTAEAAWIGTDSFADPRK